MGKRACLLVLVAAAGCATVGREFSTTDLNWIKPGETTKQDVLGRLGDPFRVGMDAGDQTWTYGYYKYRLVGQSNAKDLIFRFDGTGRVKTYTFNTTFQEEKEQLDPAVKPSPASP